MFILILLLKLVVIVQKIKVVRKADQMVLKFSRDFHWKSESQRVRR
jgi:hypothetical protein